MSFSPNCSRRRSFFDLPVGNKTVSRKVIKRPPKEQFCSLRSQKTTFDGTVLFREKSKNDFPGFKIVLLHPCLTKNIGLREDETVKVYSFRCAPVAFTPSASLQSPPLVSFVSFARKCRRRVLRPKQKIGKRRV